MKMKKTLKFTVVMLFMVSLCACGNKEVETETEPMGTDIAVSDVATQYDNYDNNVTMQYSKDEPEEIPFYVLLNKTAFQSESKNSDIITITTDLTDWDYTVIADYGEITNKEQSSFVYNKPEEQNGDNIFISFVDKTTDKEYSTLLPLTFVEGGSGAGLSINFFP